MRPAMFTSMSTTKCDIRGRSKVASHITEKWPRSCMWMFHIIVLALVVIFAADPGWGQHPTQSSTAKTRTEKNLLGEKQVPADAYYGVQTARALENFQLSGIPINHYPEFIDAWAIVKLAAAQANTDVGAMKPERLAAIEKAAQAVRDGKYRDQFMVDWYQGGAGTSTNMNANEVLANIGLELTGHKKGEYRFLEPHDDLNMSQSTNDSYPTAITVALLLRNDKLVDELQRLSASFRTKGNAYLKVVKMGRTELQDAVPMTVGQEFNAFAASLDGEIAELKQAEKSLYVVNMGATAIGTGMMLRKDTSTNVRRTWRRSWANPSFRPTICLPLHGISKDLWSIPLLSRAWRSSFPKLLAI